MNDELNLGEANESSSISRRNALKAATAVGVGAAAWGGPQIGILGQTPAYAMACSQPWIPVAEGDCINTACANSCTEGSGSGVKFVRYKANSLSGTNGATANITEGCGSPSAAMPPPDIAMATITVPTGVPQCRVRVEIWDGNCGSGDSVIQNVTTDAVPGGSSMTIPVPKQACATLPSSIFTKTILECNNDTDVGCM